MRAWLVTLAATAVTAGCRKASPGEGELLRALGDDIDVVVVASPAAAGTWVDRAATVLVPDLPACVDARARAARAVAAVWNQRDGADGAWTLVMVGGGASVAGCDALGHGDGLTWYGADPRTGGRRFFADAERRRRWRALGDAPVRALGDATVQPGIVVHAAGSIETADGVDARVTLRFDERAAADGADALFARWYRHLDRDRLGGAWPALQWTFAKDPRDAQGTTLLAELRLPGVGGEQAAVLAAAALAAGTLGAAGAPCPTIDALWKTMIDCTANGRFTIAPSLRDMIVANPGELAGDARMVGAVKGGAPAGVKIYAIQPSSLWASLGFESGDRIHTVGGAELTTVDGARDALQQLRDATEIVVELERRGRDVALRYQVR